jgi:Uma2 family endonuclease
MRTTTPPDVAPEIESYFAGLHIQLLPAVPMTQDQFFEFCQQNRKLRCERTARGELIIRPPSGGGTGKRNLSVGALLYNWSVNDGTGEPYDSSTGFILPSGANRSPDASWILNTRLAGLSAAEKEKFIPICPDFVVEMMSPSDSLAQTQEKMTEYVDNGARLGWLIDPKRKQVHVYRPGQPVQVLDNPQTIRGDPELPGFVLDLKPVWLP